ncbi:MAG TPA: PIN domain-containing protein [Thermoanaerobaculia bacterium]|jgi:predicted nucleic acid-binding protein|nr:PIN domain-containing protein [Thermoanaerobaculia bacterium]
MTDKVFLDTNVLAYLYDQDAPEKQQRARSILERSLANADLVISTQVLQEFWVTVTRKFAKSLPVNEAVLAMQALRNLPTIQIDVGMIFEAIDLGRRFQLSFWDALVVQAALASGCSRLLTEDLQHGFQIGSLTVENPFR